jgi:uncharacterized protein
MARYFLSSFVVTAIGIALAAVLGWQSTGTLGGVAAITFIVSVLAILEVSLSFDNAVVNAKVLQGMDAVWRHRFITWGMAIAVFGMRIVFPLVIVAIITGTGLWAAAVLAVTNPDGYAAAISSAHISVSAFGGAFLTMVGLRHFFDHEKDVHWLAMIERPLARLGRVEAVAIGLVLVLLYGIAGWLPEHERLTFFKAGIAGLVTYIAVDGVAALLGTDVSPTAARTGAAGFLYLEVLDASFSFDGVIGALALSHNLFVITIGLGIGAMFVRSLTIMLVEEGTLTQYRFLEHGAFWAIIALGGIMLLETVVEISEVVTGLVGAAFIAAAFVSSIRHNRAAR